MSRVRDGGGCEQRGDGEGHGENGAESALDKQRGELLWTFVAVTL